MVVLYGAENCAIDNCTFQALDSINFGDNERRPGIYGRNDTVGNCGNLKIINNTINDTYNGIVSGGTATGWDVVGNTIRAAWNDGCKIGAASNQRYNWNFMIDKKHPDGDENAHGDFLQIVGQTDPTVSNVQVIGNVHARGANRPGFNDGQGLFLAGATYNDTWVIGNRVVVGFANNINWGTIGTGCIVRQNTSLMDVEANTADANITAIGADSDYNAIGRSSAGGTNVAISRYAGYDANFVGGQANLGGSSIGSTLTDVLANTDVKSGSTIDTASPKVGAHQDYIDYHSRWLNLPYTLPNGEGQEGFPNARKKALRIGAAPILIGNFPIIF